MEKRLTKDEFWDSYYVDFGGSISKDQLIKEALKTGFIKECEDDLNLFIVLYDECFVHYAVHPERINLIVVPKGTVKRVIVASANLYIFNDKEVIVCGSRHFCPAMSSVLDVLDKLNGFPMKPKEQGFIDQYGKFITRKDAKIIATLNNQKLRTPFRSDIAFSEDFW